MNREIEFFPENKYNGVEMSMNLKGEHGCVQFRLGTGWFSSEEKERIIRRHDHEDYNYLFEPLAHELGYHSYKAISSNIEIRYDGCELLNGKPCYYFGTTCGASHVFDILVKEGSEKAWEELEKYYIDIFGELK